MEGFEISKEKLVKIRDITIFALLLLWMIMPIIQTLKGIYKIIDVVDFYFILMKIIGVVGLVISVFDIYDKVKNATNKKLALKEILPIFIFVLYMAWTLISCYLSPNKNNAFKGHFYRREGYYMYINYAGYFLCAFLLKNEKLKKALLNTFIITTLFLIVMSRVSLGGKKFTDIFVNNTIEQTVFAQFNHYGYYLTMAFACVLGLFITEKNKIIKIIYLISYAIIGYALIYNDTFGCYLAVVSILILYGIYSLIKKTDRKLILFAIVIFVLLSCITVKDGSNLAYRNISELAGDIKIIIYNITGKKDIKTDENEQKEEHTQQSETEQGQEGKTLEEVGTSRILLWKNGIKFVSERPIIGYGPDNLRPYYSEAGVPHDRPHNLLIYLAAVSGIPGMLIYITAVGIIIIKGIKKLFEKNKKGTIYLIVVIAYLISSMFGNSMYYTSPYFFIFLGSLMNYNLIKTEE